jgi:phage tail P2-like protein
MKELQDLDLADISPQSLLADPMVKAILDGITVELKSYTQDLAQLLIIPNIKTLNVDVLEHVMAMFKVDFDDDSLPIAQRRKMLLQSLQWHAIKGTPAAVENLITQVFGKAVVQEWWQYGGSPYHFRILTSDTIVDPIEIAKINRFVGIAKNARSQFDGIFRAASAKAQEYEGVAIFRFRSQTIRAKSLN